MALLLTILTAPMISLADGPCPSLGGMYKDPETQGPVQVAQMQNAAGNVVYRVTADGADSWEIGSTQKEVGYTGLTTVTTTTCEDNQVVITTTQTSDMNPQPSQSKLYVYKNDSGDLVERQEPGSATITYKHQ